MSPYREAAALLEQRIAEAEADARRRDRRMRLAVAAGAIVLALLSGWVIWATLIRDEQAGVTRRIATGNQQAVDGIQRNAAQARAFDLESCRRDRVTIRQLRTIIRASRQSLAQYRREGLLSPAQYRRALEDSDRALARLTPVHCADEKPRR